MHIGLIIDQSAHTMDGLLLHGRAGDQPIEAFISRRVLDQWVEPREPPGRRKSLFRAEYNALGQRNLAAIERIVQTKYTRGPSFNRQHPFLDVLLADITESGERPLPELN
jgi:hypothetical protein